MTYSCSDFADSIIEVLKVAVPQRSNDIPADQADLCLAEIRRLQAFEEAAKTAIKNAEEYVWRYAELNDETKNGDCRKAHKALVAVLK